MRLGHVHVPFLGSVATAAVLRVVAMVLGVLAGVVIARLGGPEAKGVFSSFAALLSIVFLFLNFDIPQQALRAARDFGDVGEALPWMRRVWLIYISVGIPVAAVGALVNSSFALVSVGGIVVTVVTQSGVVAVGTRGPVNYATSAIVNQGSGLLAAVLLGMLGVLNASTAPLIVLFGFLSSLLVMWIGAPISVVAPAKLDLALRKAVVGGVGWQLLRSAQTVMLKLDILWVTAVLGAAGAGVYSVALSTAMLINVFPQQVSNQILSDILRRKAYDWRRSVWTSLFAGLVVAIPLAVAGWFFIPVVYGEAFVDSRLPLLIALVGVTAYGGIQTMSNLIRNVGDRWDFALLTLPGFATMSGLLFSLVPLMGLVGAAMSFSSGMLVSLLLGFPVCSRVDSRNAD